MLARAAAIAPTGSDAASCVLSPEVTEGPYWVSNKLKRRNITEGRPGVALQLVLTVESTDCKPIKGADVEIWHADAGGVYSDVGGNTQTFLRGHQKSDSDGKVRFDTIYPGWYRGRTPHIHVKVHVGGQVVHTGQIFFSDSVSAVVYATSKYKSHGQADTTNAADSIYAQAGGSRAKAKVRKRSSGKRYKGAATLIVQT